MAVSKRAVLALSGMVAGVGLLTIVAMTPAAAGSTPAASTAVAGPAVPPGTLPPITSPPTSRPPVTLPPITSPPTSRPPVTLPPIPPPSVGVVVTQADDGKTVTVLAGQRLLVSLGPDYVPTTASGPALAKVFTRGGYPTGQPLTEVYRAVAPGQVNLTSHTDTACNHAPTPCPTPLVPWLVHVRVVAPPSTGQTVTVTTTDNLRNVALHVGDTLVVSLPSQYQPPTVAPAGVLVQRDVTGGYPSGQPLVARYLAATPGQADVSTLTDSACNHAPTPCPSPQVPWKVHVTVTA